MRQTIKELRSILEQRKGTANTLQKIINQKQQENKQKQQELEDHEQALQIIKIVGEKTQEKIKYNISEVTSLALEAVLGDEAYKLDVQFIERRDTMECDLSFEDTKGNLFNPISSTGVGAVDVAAFALRIASWSLQVPKPRNVIVLDEPFKNLDKSKHEKASQMLKQISAKLNIQFIIVTHEEKLAEAADRTFRVTKTKGVSKVKQL